MKPEGTARKSRVSGPVASLAILVLLVVIAVSMVAGVFLFTDATPSSLQSSKPVTAAPISQRDFVDKWTVDVSLSLGADSKITSPTSGLVTSLSCQVGGSFASGQSSVSLDGAPLVNLATSIPLWRDLDWGATGADVQALQAELTRLGYDVAEDGDRAGNATFAAFSALVEKNGGDANLHGTIQSMRVLWLPAVEATVKTCAAATGAPLAAGDEIAGLPGTLTRAQITKTPKDAVAGERVLMIDDQQVPVDEEGAVTDTELLAQVAASSAFAQAVQSKATTLSAGWALKKPLKVFVVPPSALYALDGQTGCVLSGERPFQVDVVGSELGQSFVTFGKSTPPKTVTPQPENAPSCR